MIFLITPNPLIIEKKKKRIFIFTLEGLYLKKKGKRQFFVDKLADVYRYNFIFIEIFDIFFFCLKYR